MMNAPRGPSHMRRQNQHDHRADRDRDRDRTRRSEPSPSKRDRDRKDVKKKDNVKTTMTDFRIVGIEIKELGWTWGMIGAHAASEQEAAGEEVKKEESGSSATAVKAELVTTDEAPPDSEQSKSTNGDAPSHAKEEQEQDGVAVDSVKQEEDANTVPDADADPASQTSTEIVKEEGTITDEVEGKVGGKRKAQSPEAGQSTGPPGDPPGSG